MVLGEVEETITSMEIDDDTFEELITTTKRQLGFLFVRGDMVTLISPSLRQ